MSIQEPAEAASWIEDNWDNPLLTSIRASGCGGPFACMLSPDTPAFALFGSYNDPVVVDMAESLADSSRFPVTIRATSDNVASNLLCAQLCVPRSMLKYSSRALDTDPHNEYVQFPDTGGTNDRTGRGLGDENEPVPEDERTPNETGNGGGRDNNPGDAETETNGHRLNTAERREPNRVGGAQNSGGGDGGGGGGEPTTVDGKWESPLHRTRVKLRLKLNPDQTYAVAIGYTFKVHGMHLTLHYSVINFLSLQSIRTRKYLLIWKT